MAVAENQLHAIAEWLDAFDTHVGRRTVDTARQAPRSAEGAGAQRPQTGMAQLLLAPVRPLQAQHAILAVQVRRRLHDWGSPSWVKASREALRTSGSPSAAAVRSAGKAARSPSSPRARAASLRKLLMG